MIRVLPVIFVMASCSPAATHQPGRGTTGEGATAAEETPEAESTSSEKQIIPQALIGVSFKNLDKAKVTDLTLGKAKKKMTEINEVFKETYNKDGHKAWFFHAFDKKKLYFFVARYHIECTDKLGCLEYIVEEIFRVSRTSKAEQELGVKQEIEFYEIGICGIKGGMTEEEVTALLGEPDSKVPLQVFGSFRLFYPELTITFWGFEVLSVQENENTQ